MKATYRVFSILMYIAMIYSTFTGIICGVLLADSKYNGFGYPIMIITLAGFAVGLVLFFLKLKWSSFFVLLGTSLARIYLAFALQRQSRWTLSSFISSICPFWQWHCFRSLRCCATKNIKKRKRALLSIKPKKICKSKKKKKYWKI